jgi:hypothetical protein
MTEISNDRYEELRQILERQNGFVYTYEEVKQIGDDLLDFFKILMEWVEEDRIVKDNNEDHNVEQW